MKIPLLALMLSLELCAAGWSQTSHFPVGNPKRLNVAIFIFPGVQVIDFAGPWEVFAQAGSNVFTVGQKTEPLKADAGLILTPEFTFENAPRADVLVLPGGDPVLQEMLDPVVIKWLVETAKQTPQVMTVCSGAFLAAKGGLLNGQTATTFYGMLDYLQQLAPGVKVVRDKKYVDSGKIVTTAGLSSGIDGSLYVLSKLLGMGRAQAVALNMEYNWNPDSSYARAMLPDMNIPHELPGGLPKGSALLSSSGDRDHWTITVRVASDEGAVGVLKNVNASVTKSGKWTMEANAANDTSSKWDFTDRFGAKWQSIINVAPGQEHTVMLILKIDRV